METLFTKTLIANQLPTAILNRAHNHAKLEYRKTHSDTLLTQAVTRITFQLECFPFTDQTFVSSRLQICTSWSSPISATTSTFVLVCCFGPNFQTSTFACYNIVLSDYNFYNVRFRFQLSTTRASCFRFVQLSALSTFPSAIFPFRHFFFPFWLRISLGILFPFSLFSFTFICPVIFFNFLFVLLQFNSAVTKIQTLRSMFQRLSPVVVLWSML